MNFEVSIFEVPWLKTNIVTSQGILHGSQTRVDSDSSTATARLRQFDSDSWTATTAMRGLLLEAPLRFLLRPQARRLLVGQTLVDRFDIEPLSDSSAK